MKIAKKIIYLIWLLAILGIIIFFILNPSSFTAENIAEFLKEFENQAIVIYILLSLARGLFLIPSTPFVLAGAILFPHMPWTIFTISMMGVLFGSSAIYFFSDLLGFSEKLEKKYPKQIQKWQRRLNSPKSIWIVIAWSFFPFVPTDLICYVAGIVKMPYRFLLAGVFIGEAVLVYFYVFLGVGIYEYCFG